MIIMFVEISNRYTGLCMQIGTIRPTLQCFCKHWSSTWMGKSINEGYPTTKKFVAFKQWWN